MAEGDVVVLPPSEDTAEEAQLRSALEQVDNDASREAAPDRVPEAPEDDAQKSESQTDEVAKEKSDSSEAEAERQRDEKGRFLPKVEKGEVQPLKEGQPPAEPEIKPDKDQARLAKSWQKIEQEKLEVRNALAEVRQLKQQLEQQRPQTQPRFGSKDYTAAADEFERQAAALMQQGEVEEAQKKLQLSRESRAYAQQIGQQEATEAQQQQSANFTREWQRHAEDAINQHPELGDPQTEAAQAMMELLEDYPILGYIPDGFKKGVELLQLRRDAALTSELRTKNEKLEQENKELRNKTAISGGGLTSKVSSKSFDDMSLDEQESYLIRQARSEDLMHT